MDTEPSRDDGLEQPVRFVGQPVEPQPDVEAPEPREQPLSFWRWLLEFVVLIGLAFLLASGVKAYVVQPFVIPSGSMENTIQIGDRVLVNKYVYRFREPQRGDIVVFKPWQAGQPDLIKRVIAVSGETIDYADGSVTIDGVAIDEPYIELRNRIIDPGELLPYKVPSGDVFVMGDNRNNSGDSRFNGPVRTKDILGRGFFVYWPPTRLGPLR